MIDFRMDLGAVQKERLDSPYILTENVTAQPRGLRPLEEHFDVGYENAMRFHIPHQNLLLQTCSRRSAQRESRAAPAGKSF